LPVERARILNWFRDKWMKVGLCYNLKKELSSVAKEDGPPLPVDFFAECDSDATISAIRDALAARHQIVMIEADEHAFEKFRTSRPEIVFKVRRANPRCRACSRCCGSRTPAPIR
jgi:hypothetical protein